MSPREIEPGARYRGNKATYVNGELIAETTHDMFRLVLDLFTGTSGEWVAYQLPWGEIRCQRRTGFARWAKERLP